MKSVEFANFLTKGMGKAQAFAKIQYGNFVNSISFYTESACFILRILSTWQICKNDIFIARKALIYILNINKHHCLAFFDEKYTKRKKFQFFGQSDLTPFQKSNKATL